MAEALAGSQSAFEQIVRRYQRPVIGLIERITGDRSLAEDLAQDTFVKAYRHLVAFDVSRRLSSWLFRIAHNTAIDALRRPRPVLVPLEDAGAAGTSDGPAAPAAADPVERAALGEALQAALSRLRPAYRAAIALRYDEGLPFEEIGHVMGVPEVTARTYVHRARKELAEALAGAGWSPARS